MPILLKAGLDLFNADGIVAVHDAVRPPISEMLIEKAFPGWLRQRQCIPFIKPRDPCVF